MKKVDGTRIKYKYFDEKAFFQVPKRLKPATSNIY